MRKHTLVLVALLVGLVTSVFAGGELPAVPAVPPPAPPAPVVVEPIAEGAVSAGARIQEYVTNRAKDLVSIVRVEIGAGPGIGISGQVTNAVSAGIANYDSAGTALYNSEIIQYEAARKEGGLKVLDYTLGVVNPRDPGEIAIEAHAGVGFGFGVNLVKAKDFVVGFTEF